MYWRMQIKMRRFAVHLVLKKRNIVKLRAHNSAG